MRFEQPDWLWVALTGTLVGLGLVYLWYRRRQRAVTALGSTGMLERLTRVDLRGSPARRALLVAGVLGLMGLALANPQWGTEEVEEQTRALSVVLALDVSESMWAEDARPNRLERERLEARRLVTELAGHRIGLVAFAGAAYLLSPLTVDHGAIHLYLDAIEPTMAGTPGSSLRAAIDRATELFEERSDGGGDRAVVILTDGEAHEDEREVLRAARRAADARVRLYAVGIGGEAGEPIPRRDRTGERLGGYKRDSEGRVVLSRLVRDPLMEAAQTTGGFWTRAEEGGTSRVLAALADLQRGRAEATRGVRWTHRFQWFVGLALALLIADSTLARRGRT